MKYIAAAALGDSHQERWRESVDEFEHLRKNPDEECCLVRSAPVISPAARTNARTPEFISAIISFGRLRIALSFVNTIHPFRPASGNHSGSDTPRSNLSVTL